MQTESGSVYSGCWSHCKLREGATGAGGWGPSHITKVLGFELHPQGHREPIKVLSVEEREELLSDRIKL